VKLYIVTRFNMRWKKIDNYSYWMSERLNLFENYHLSSLSKQTNKNFEIVLLIQQGTDKKYLNSLDDLSKKYSIKFNIVYCNGTKDFQENTHKFLKGKTCVVSRIDSDDCVSREYVENILNFYKNEKNRDKIFDYKRLYYLNVNTDECILANYNPGSMFLSIFYTKYMPYDMPHDMLSKSTGIRIFKSEHNDVACICHGTNITNSVSKAKSRFKYKKVPKITWYK